MNELQIILTLASASLVLLLLLIFMFYRHRQQLNEGRENNVQLVQLLADLKKDLQEERYKQQQQSSELQQKISDRIAQQQQSIERRLGEMAEQQAERLAKFNESTQNTLHQHKQSFEERQQEAQVLQQKNIQSGMDDVRKQVAESLKQYSEELGRQLTRLTQTTDDRLKEISGQVEKRLTVGFEKTTATFTDIVKRLTMIDEAQKKITELSGSVVSLQEVLSDKRSRGAFGEVQLNSLVRNLMPESSFAFQYSLSNNTRVDCMLFLPEPTGNIAIDSKFPLESYKKITDIELSDSDRLAAERQFKQDIRKHIKDIADKYIIPGETSDGAVMFLPAESVFAEIHSHFYELVEEAQRARVWLVSPTTLMAVLTTARAVLKDSATRKQVHLIQEHLVALSKDFGRFQTRMDNLAKHIQQANKDVDEVNTSARKITSRFEKIEKVEVTEDAQVNVLKHEEP